jgi:hypothetical protein
MLYSLGPSGNLSEARVCSQAPIADLFEASVSIGSSQQRHMSGLYVETVALRYGFVV